MDGYRRAIKIPTASKTPSSRADCEQVFIDHASGKLASRPKLVEALRIARDELIITKLDRLGCSLEHLIGTDLDW